MDKKEASDFLENLFTVSPILAISWGKMGDIYGSSLTILLLGRILDSRTDPLIHKKDGVSPWRQESSFCRVFCCI